MPTEIPAAPETLTAIIDLSLSGRTGRLEVPVPAGPVLPIELLPLLQSLTDTLVAIAVEDAEVTGSQISCRKGCGACCRQLVPIAGVEVEAMRRIVDKLPEGRRALVRERFADAHQRLDAAGLLRQLREPLAIPRAALESLGIAYFSLGIACPFLDDESCSIHAERPLSCREYLVVSPAEHCVRPTPSTIKCVKIPAKVSNAARHLDAPSETVAPPWIPLILALEWEDASQTPAAATQTGTAQMAKVFTHLFKQDIPDPESAGKAMITSA
jgi:Fe-S-cluster containining protein